MPFKRRFKRGRRYVRRRGGRRAYRSRAGGRVRIPVGVRAVGTTGSIKRTGWAQVFAVSKNMRFVYVDDGFNTNIAATQVDQIYRGNSLFDPDHTGVGVQPYGHDQWVPFFNRYKVFASKITIYVNNVAHNAGADSAFRIFMFAKGSTGRTYTDPSDLSVYPGCKQTSICWTSSTHRERKISAYATTRRILPSNFMGNPVTGSFGIGDPGFCWYWHVIFDNTGGGQDIHVYWSVKIRYYARLTGAKTMNES